MFYVQGARTLITMRAVFFLVLLALMESITRRNIEKEEEIETTRQTLLCRHFICGMRSLYNYHSIVLRYFNKVTAVTTEFNRVSTYCTYGPAVERAGRREMCSQRCSITLIILSLSHSFSTLYCAMCAYESVQRIAAAFLFHSDICRHFLFRFVHQLNANRQKAAITNLSKK